MTEPPPGCTDGYASIQSAAQRASEEVSSLASLAISARAKVESLQILYDDVRKKTDRMELDIKEFSKLKMAHGTKIMEQEMKIFELNSVLTRKKQELESTLKNYQTNLDNKDDVIKELQNQLAISETEKGSLKETIEEIGRSRTASLQLVKTTKSAVVINLDVRLSTMLKSP
jgi:chromosome segregation ATPase